MHPYTSRALARSRAAPRRAALVAIAAAAVAGAITPPSALAGPTGIVLTTDNRLHSFDTDNPGAITGSVAITGLDSSFEDVLGIDFRPAQPGQLYALSSFGQVYQINVSTGVATAVGAELDPDDVPLDGDNFGFDFNPVVDRVRVNSDTGENYRVHPDTGALVAVDGDLSYAAGDVNAGVLSGVTAAAYTNNDDGAGTGTTLYDIDSELGVLAIQNPPNSGGLETVGSLGLDDNPLVAGFDITGAANDAYAATTAEEAVFGLPALPSRLYGISLDTGLATDLGLIGDGSLLIGGLAVSGDITAIPLPPALWSAPLAAAMVGAFHRRFRRPRAARA